MALPLLADGDGLQIGRVAANSRGQPTRVVLQLMGW
jgi:hypothetical protein